MMGFSKITDVPYLADGSATITVVIKSSKAPEEPLSLTVNEPGEYFVKVTDADGVEEALSLTVNAPGESQ